MISCAVVSDDDDGDDAVVTRECWMMDGIAVTVVDVSSSRTVTEFHTTMEPTMVEERAERVELEEAQKLAYDDF